MRFPVLRYETKYGVDYRVGATEANQRSGSKNWGAIEARDKRQAISRLKDTLETALIKSKSYHPLY